MRATISILTYSAVAQAKACLASVLAGGGEFDLILTANGSHEALALFEEMKSKRPGTIVVARSQNDGFIEPNRYALSLTTNPLFVILNDDAIVPPGWLDLLVSEFAKFPTAALAGPTGGCNSLHSNFHGFVGSNFEYLEGSCLACKTEIVKKHGLFDPHLNFAYGEDSDLSLRMRELGYTLHRANFTIRHERNATSRHVAEVAVWQERNHAFLRQRWANYLQTRRFGNPIVVRRQGAFGDILMTTPVIRQLKKDRPTSEIYVECLMPEIFDRNPNVLKAARQLGPIPGAQYIVLDGVYEAQPDRHFVTSYAERAGVAVEDMQMEIHPQESDHAFAKQVLQGDDWVALHIGPNTWPTKEWPKDRFAVLAKNLKEMGFKIVLVGNADRDMTVPHDSDMRGRTSVHQLAALFCRVEFAVTLDSFPMHVCQAVGCQVVGLFGITLPEFILTASNAVGVKSDPAHPASGLRHRVKNATSTPHAQNPMETITVEQVMKAIATLQVQLPEDFS